MNNSSIILAIIGAVVTIICCAIGQIAFIILALKDSKAQFKKEIGDSDLYCTEIIEKHSKQHRKDLFNTTVAIKQEIQDKIKLNQTEMTGIFMAGKMDERINPSDFNPLTDFGAVPNGFGISQKGELG